MQPSHQSNERHLRYWTRDESFFKMILTSQTKVLSKSSYLPILPSRRPKLRRQRVVRVRAEDEEVDIVITLPEGVTQPKKIPEIPAPMFGFVEYAERINSRAAMIGFIGILIIEFFANRGILQLAGISVGSGLGFEI